MMVDLKLQVAWLEFVYSHHHTDGVLLRLVMFDRWPNPRLIELMIHPFLCVYHRVNRTHELPILDVLHRSASAQMPVW